MTQQVAFVETGVDLVGRQHQRDVRVAADQLAQRATLVGGAQRGRWTIAVGLLARQAARLDECRQQTAAAEQPQAAVEVLAHSLGPHDQPVDQAAEA